MSYHISYLICHLSYASVCNDCETLLIFQQNNKVQLLKSLLESRGPDISSSQILAVNNSSSTTVHLSGYVLWTQGANPEPQPYIDLSETYYLLFNGDLYNDCSKEACCYENSSFQDGLHLFHRLRLASGENEFLDVVSKIRGPFAFVFFDRINEEVWFGRDFFGRESLLLSYDSDYSNSVIISSVSVFQNVFELPTFGIYRYSISDNSIVAYPWASHRRNEILKNFDKFSSFLELAGISLHTCSDLLIHCIPTLLKSVSDVSVDKILNQLTLLSSTESIELLSHATRILDAETNQFLDRLRSAVKKRVQGLPPFCKHCIKARIPCTHARVGVLFSGGIDSTMIAYLAAESLSNEESLDLLNVAFYKNDTEDKKALIPDRETGLEAYGILKAKFPNLSINFIPIDVTKSEVEIMRRDRIRHLISPQCSVLDDSLGCCLWFAAQGRHQSSARILLVGSGADELLGGYSRYRSAFQNGNWEELRKEMQYDMDRISVRNLGRDNRIVSDHGVAPRMPFLDEDVVEFLTKRCDVWLKCYPLAPFKREIGDKLLLRATALKVLGNVGERVALFPKRAMQFGSRIAKLENGKEKGGDECPRLNYV